MFASVFFAATLAAAVQFPSQLLPGPDIRPVLPPYVSVRVEDQGVVFLPLAVADGDRPLLEAGVWLPQSTGGPFPLIVISHGSGGAFSGHETTARALAEAGFAVAALTHAGDNWRDGSRSTDAADRVRQLTVLIEFMLEQWEGRSRLDAGRVGAFGFSFGGFTVLTAAGGRPDLSRVIEHCRLHPRLLRLPQPGPAWLWARHGVWNHDPRIRAIVVAAPALGFTFDGEGLSQVTQPVQLWQAGRDEILPAPFYVEPVRAALSPTAEYHLVEGAGHFDFMPPCSPRLEAAAPQICASPEGFDRSAFHVRFNTEVIRFFTETLK